MNESPRVPTDPLDLQGLVAGLSPEELIALVQQIDGGLAARALGQFGAFGPRNREIDLPPPPDEASLLTLTIDLRDAEPRIWRRLSLPGDLTLDAAHTLLQAAMGWTDSHLHRFEPGVDDGWQQPYFITEFDEQEGDEGTREESVRLDQVLRAPGDRLTYRYDFGDGWEHLITLESLAPLAQDDQEPTCLAGAGACPPEDVGGIGAHEEIAAWLRAGAPGHRVPEPFQNAEEAHDWLPVDYDPDAFDAVEATAAMRVWASGEHLPWHALPEPLAVLLRELQGRGWVEADAWLTALGPRVAVELDEDDVRRAARPWLAVLDAVGPGTKLTAAGYLPPAMVEQIGQASGVLDSWIGKANREDLTWPVAALRANAQEVGLLRKAKGTLAPTARARAAAGRPRQLVATVLDRLPLGKGFAAEAGWFALLGSAAGASGAGLDARVAQMLADRGWRMRDGSGVSPAQAHGGARRTLDALESMAGGEAPDPGLLTQLARAALFGVAEPA